MVHRGIRESKAFRASRVKLDLMAHRGIRESKAFRGFRESKVMWVRTDHRGSKDLMAIQRMMLLSQTALSEARLLGWLLWLAQRERLALTGQTVQTVPMAQ
jgi:hypothetical protein